MEVVRGSAAISNDSPGVEEMIDTCDQPGGTSAIGTYAGTNKYADGLEDEPVVKGGASGIVEMIDKFDRPGKAFAKGTYAGTDKYAVGLQNKPGKRIPKAGVSASAGVGHAGAEWRICDAEAKGPNASAGVGASVGTFSAEAFARAELASASASAGPLKATAVVKAGAAISFGAFGLVEMIDTFDRPGDAFAKGTYAGTNKYAVGLENKHGKRIPKAGVSASAGVGHARAEWRICEAEAKGPNASAGVGASAGTLSAEAFARAEVASASASAGPLKATAVVKAGAAISCGASGIVEMIDTIDRPGKAFAKGTYAGTNKYAVGLEDKPGKRIPKAGVSASAGVGYARAEWRICEAEAKGPNASAGVGASAGTLSAEAFARAEVASASASAGPLKATVGLSADTGVTVGVTQLEAKVLGTGISFGRKMGISLLGTGVEVNL